MHIDTYTSTLAQWPPTKPAINQAKGGNQMDLQITVEGRTYVAEPRPEDQQTLEQLLSRGEDITIAQSDGDTEGHVLAADEISLDVEGHAMTLRLPAAGDAAALRRALAVGALTATVAIGGFVAGTQVGTQAAPLSAPAARRSAQAPRAPTPSRRRALTRARMPRQRSQTPTRARTSRPRRAPIRLRSSRPPRSGRSQTQVPATAGPRSNNPLARPATRPQRASRPRVATSSAFRLCRMDDFPAVRSRMDARGQPDHTPRQHQPANTERR